MVNLAERLDNIASLLERAPQPEPASARATALEEAAKVAENLYAGDMQRRYPSPSRAEAVRVTFKPNAVCPKCHRPAAIRYYEATVLWAKTLEADDPIENVVCTKPGCGTIYVIAAVNLHHAEIAVSIGREALCIAKQSRVA